MSAIVGIFNLDGSGVEAQKIHQMVASLSHRGPDGSGVWQQASIGLGQCMLWTTPDSRHEQLPLVSPDGSLALTADARIDNRLELVRELNLPIKNCYAITDSELILKAYEKWGIACPHHLVGDFAFGIWDARNRRLFCARDPMGVKPFYYFHSHKLFSFASEIKALFNLPEIPRRLNETHLGEQLALYSATDSTYFTDIYRLPAAHTLCITPGEIKIHRYWLLNSIQDVRFKNDDEYYEAFRQIFTEAVRCRLNSAFALGSTLSGGLDSSSIACVARDIYRKSHNELLHTFSAIFPSLPEEELKIIDERSYISNVLSQGGFTPHMIEADRLSLTAGVGELLWRDDEPIGAPNLYLHAAMYSSARDNGLRIFLDGIDGDTAISYGYQYLAELTMGVQLGKLIKEARAIAQHYPSSHGITRNIIWKYGLRPLVPEPFIHLWRALRRKDAPSGDIGKAINPAFARQIGLIERIQRLEEYTWKGAKHHHWHGINQPVNAHILEIADKTAARYSLEGRYPFFDRRLLEFTVGLPARFKLHEGWSRFILRQSMQGILPADVQWRINKSDLSPNYQILMLELAKDDMEIVLDDKNEILRPYLDLAALNAYYRAYRSQPTQRSQEALIVFRAYVLAKWLEHAWV